MSAPDERILRRGLARSDCLTPFEEAGTLDELDVELARRLIRLSGRSLQELRQPDPPVWSAVQLEALAAAMASRAPEHGHLCFDVRTAGSTPIESPDGDPEDAPAELPWPRDVDGWLATLRTGSVLVRTPAQARACPLVLDEAGRLYLDRYYRYEDRLATDLLDRMAASDGADRADEAEVLRLVEDLRLLVPDAESVTRQPGIDGQRYAALVACLNSFSIVSGGPGTGKTSTVTVLALLLMRQRERARLAPLRIQLVAPTGKAAARMTEAIRDEVNALERGVRGRVARDAAAWDTHLTQILALEGSTIHRALGVRPDEPTQPRYRRDNPLPVDLVIVDEASMVDCALMTRLVEAVPRTARLVLLGDRDQLASVEAGAVLADACVRPGPRPPVSPWLARIAKRHLGQDVDAASDGPAIRSCVANLDFSFRFDNARGIVELAQAIRDHRVQTALEVVGCLEPGVAGTGKDHVTWRALKEDADLAADEGRDLRREIVEGWTAPGVDENGEPRSVKAALDLLRKADKDGHLTARKRLAKTALDRLDRIRVLCTHRRGPRGVETMNRLVRDWLRGAMPGAGDWFEGQPILVLQNDYHVRLFNGDVGIVLRDPFAITPAEGDRLVAVFPDSGSPDGVRAVPQGRLPPYETVFAMTIHKSQGSQFDRVVVLLPARDSDFVTRELLYTGITRARTHVTLAGDATVLRTCLARRVQRASGLRKRLWNEEPVDLPEASGSHC